jgi:hypothetical protein
VQLRKEVTRGIDSRYVSLFDQATQRLETGGLMRLRRAVAYPSWELNL